MLMKYVGVKGFKTSGSINLYNYDFTFVNTEDILLLTMAKLVRNNRLCVRYSEIVISD